MEGPPDLVSIIIVNYNTAGVLADCIESVFKFEDATQFEIIIVDNSPADGSKQIIEGIVSKRGNVRAIFPGEPESFSSANNRGIEAASGEFIIIMNPDIIFTEPVLKKLLADFESDPELGALTPSLIGTDGKFQRIYFQRYPTVMQFLLFYTVYAKLFFRFRGLKNRWLENHDIDIRQNKLWTVEQIPCAFFMSRSKTIREIGMMDDRFDLFFEDTDLSFRIHKTSKLAVDSSLRVTHLGGASFRNDENWQVYGKFIKSMRYYVKKHNGSFKSGLIKFFALSNSLTVLTFEYVLKIVGKSSEYRMKKHKYLLKLLV